MIKTKRKDIIMTRKSNNGIDQVLSIFRFQLPEDPILVAARQRERARSKAAYSRVKRLMKKYAELGLGYDLETYEYAIGKWVYMSQDWEDYISAAIQHTKMPINLVMGVTMRIGMTLRGSCSIWLSLHLSGLTKRRLDR